MESTSTGSTPTESTLTESTLTESTPTESTPTENTTPAHRSGTASNGPKNGFRASTLPGATPGSSRSG